MPELPDVEGFRRVAAQAVGRRVADVRVHDSQVLRPREPDRFARTLRGRTAKCPWRHGKWLVVPMDDGFPAVLLHFGMTGSLRWCSPEAETHRHDRVIFSFDDGEVRYRDMRKLKGIHLATDQSDVDDVLGGLGPDALDVPDATFRERLTRRRRQLKPALLDQAVVAGLGNLCADEILWQARLHPRRGTRELDDAELGRLCRGTRSMLRQSVRAGRLLDDPSWLTGHRDDPGAECPRCSTRLRQERLGGRSTVWCPRCQPE